MNVDNGHSSEKRWEAGDLAVDRATGSEERLLECRTIDNQRFGPRKQWLVVNVRARGRALPHWTDAGYLDRCFERIPRDEVDLGIDDPLVRAFADLDPSRRKAVVESLACSDPVTFEMLLEGRRRHDSTTGL